MAEIKWNQDALRQAAQQTFDAAAARMQTILDSVLASEIGKDIPAVRATLSGRWQ